MSDLTVNIPLSDKKGQGLEPQAPALQATGSSCAGAFLSLVLTTHSCLDLKNFSQHSHYQNSYILMKSMNLASPPLPPMKKPEDS